MWVIVLSVCGAVGVLWLQARWILSAAVRELEIQRGAVLYLQAEVLWRWHMRVQKAICRAAVFGAEWRDVLPPALGENLFVFLNQPGPGLGFRGDSRRVLPEALEAELNRLHLALKDAERVVLQRASICRWSVDRVARFDGLVETARFRRRMIWLQQCQRQLERQRSCLRVKKGRARC